MPHTEVLFRQIQKIETDIANVREALNNFERIITNCWTREMSTRRLIKTYLRKDSLVVLSIEKNLVDSILEFNLKKK